MVDIPLSNATDQQAVLLFKDTIIKTYNKIIIIKTRCKIIKKVQNLNFDVLTVLLSSMHRNSNRVPLCHKKYYNSIELLGKMLLQF